MGVVNLEVAADVRREGYATYLTGEIFRWAREQGVVVVETQTFANNAAADSLLESLGATVVDTGNVYRKLAPGVSSQKLEELKRQFPDYQSLFAAEL
ncbi:MAG: GNAT family N-acetyltransferase [Pirellulales bacterium]